ncbi:MAG TPA: DNA repair protein RadA [Ilumatobacteraceae bacterium]
MAKLRTMQVCSECGTSHPKWVGQCVGCGEWNSLVEEVVASPLPVAAGPPGQRTSTPMQIGAVDTAVGRPRPTGIGELDRVLGGGLVPGSVTLLGGEPGIGKSTLLLQLLAWWPGPTLYVSAEESAQQVRLRADRLRAVRPGLWLLAETSLPDIVTAIDEVQPELVVVDSIQTVEDPSLGSPPGGVVQVRGCAHRLVVEAKRRGLPVIMVGHVTKDGGLAGPRVLEHIVDTVLAFEGDRHHALRMLRATKHRFGPTDELGLFEMVGTGLVGVPDPSTLFLADRRTGVPGSVVVPTLEGQRPLVVEVQALTSKVSTQVPPRRTAQGIDSGRLALLLAVLDKRARIATGEHDVYASTVGGVRLTEPGLDLGICLALVGAIHDLPVPADMVAFGEVGLGGEVRQVAHASRRLAEAARLGFTRALVPTNSPHSDALRAIRVATVPEALAAAGLLGESLAGARR